MKSIPALAAALFAATLSTSSFAETDFSCPDKPNCVSSQATGDHYIEPINLSGKTTAEIVTAIETVLGHWENIAITSTQDNEIKAISTSKWFKFKDDISLKINSDGTVDVKSASRTGYSDLGVNRERVESLRKKLVNQ